MLPTEKWNEKFSQKFFSSVNYQIYSTIKKNKKIKTYLNLHQCVSMSHVEFGQSALLVQLTLLRHV